VSDDSHQRTPRPRGRTLASQRSSPAPTRLLSEVLRS
jgi:hypothetical protein